MRVDKPVARRGFIKLVMAASATAGAWAAGLIPEVTSASSSPLAAAEALPTGATRISGPQLHELVKQAFADGRVQWLRHEAVRRGFQHDPYSPEPVAIDAGGSRHLLHLTFASNSGSKDFFYLQVVRANSAISSVSGFTVHYLRDGATTVAEARGAIDVQPVELPAQPVGLLAGVLTAYAWGPSCPNHESAGCCWLDCTLSCCGPGVLGCAFAGPAFPECAVVVCGLWCVNFCLGWTCVNCPGGTYC